MVSVKTCSKCGEVKPLDGFHRDRSMSTGRSSYCKECANAYRREWRAQNPKRERENQKRSRKRNGDATRAYNRRWNEQNKEWRRDYNRRYYEQHQEQLQEYQRRNYEENRERYVAHATRRRAQIEGRLTQDDKDYLEILRRDPCAYCGAEGGEIDHIEPLSQGGTVDWTNLTAACRSCNRRKHTASLLDFMARSPAR